MWVYNASNGNLSHNGRLIGTGYSGHGLGLNNSALEDEPNIGPIPRGQWTIMPAFDAPDTGPMSMPLTPDEGTETFGRSGFRMHGDSLEFAGQEEASHGCIVIARSVRMLVSLSTDNALQVV
jgi:hypothetical protein